MTCGEEAHVPSKADRREAAIDLTGRTITTFVLQAIHQALDGVEVGDRVEAITEPLPAIDADIQAWSDATGNTIAEVTPDGRGRR